MSKHLVICEKCGNEYIDGQECSCCELSSIKEIEKIKTNAGSDKLDKAIEVIENITRTKEGE